MLRDKSLHPLSHQHHNGLALCVLTERSLAQDESRENIARLASRVVDRFELEMTNHFQLEEELLFPAVGAETPLVAGLLADHRKLEGLVLRLKNEPDAATLREFMALLRAHIRLEENELFEQAQIRLDRATLDSLGEQFESRAVRVCL